MTTAYRSLVSSGPQPRASSFERHEPSLSGRAPSLAPQQEEEEYEEEEEEEEEEDEEVETFDEFVLDESDSFDALFSP